MKVLRFFFLGFIQASGVFEYTYDREEDPHAPRNLIMMIPDGTSPQVWTMARAVLNQPTNGHRPRKNLNLDALLRGTVKTWSNSSLVPDSAATATAYATGAKTYNGAIGMDMKKRPLGNILEAAKARGMVTGLIVTCRVTHATPAAFSAHVSDRDSEDEIAAQIVENKHADIILGGGGQFFSAVQRQEMADAGYTIVTTEEDLRTYRRRNENSSGNSPLRLLGLFARDHLAFEIDRHRTSQPSLSTMVAEVLELLRSDSRARANGFFLMIEGSRVDHGAHVNDPVAMVRDALEFDKTVGLVKTQVETQPNTALVSVADHGTGGLTLGKAGIYAWEPEVLARTQMSTEWMGLMLVKVLKACEKPVKDNKECQQLLVSKSRDLLAHYAHIPTFTAKHLEWIKTQVHEILHSGSEKTYELERVLGWIISDHARVAWTTGGHDGSDVQLYCYGPAFLEHMCQGVHENTFVHHIMKTYLVLDTQTESLRLRESKSRKAATTKKQHLRRYHHGHSADL